MRRVGMIVGLFALLAAGALAWALWGDDAREPGRFVTPSNRFSARNAPPPPVILRGHPGAARPAPGAVAAAPVATFKAAPPIPSAPVQALTPRAVAAAAQRWVVNAPRAPGRPHHPDPDLGDPTHRALVSRHDLLGRPVAGRGPWIPDGRGLLVDGVVELTATDELQTDVDEADEIEDPLMTAVIGRVVSPEAPVAGAVVILYSSFYLRHARYDHHVREVGRTTTDGDGGFDLRPVGVDTVHFGADGEVLLTIHSAGLASVVAKRLDNLLPEQENDLGTFMLSPAEASVSGTVLDRKGQPVVGAAVRVSGHMNPVIYDKTERMVVLKDCPTAITDEEGSYRLGGFAPGRQTISIHVNIDCVLQLDRTYVKGGHDWSPRVLAGGSVTGRVIDGAGEPIAKAVVSGGGNWTPTNPDGTFWLDNIEDGPFPLQVVHHAFHSVSLADIAAGTEDLQIVVDAPLPRIRLRVRAADTGEPFPIIAIDWTWTGGGPNRFAPVSPFWHGKDGVIEVVVPEGAATASISATGCTPAVLEAHLLDTGLEHDLVLAREPPAGD